MALHTETDLERKQPLQSREGWRLQFTVDTYRAIIQDLKSATDEGVTSVLATGGTQGGGTGDVSISLTNTGVVPGTYTTANITVDEQGRITLASNGSAAASVGTSNEFQITDNSGGFLASVVQQSGTHIIPTTTKVTDLGSTTNRFNDLFIDSTIDYSANDLIFKANNVTKVTFGSNGGTQINSLYDLFLNSSDIRFNTGGTSSVIKEDGGTTKLSLSNSLTKVRWRSVIAGEGNGIWIGGNGGNPTFANRSAFFMLENTDGGFMQPSMTIAQRTAIASPIAGLQVHTEDGTDSIPYYNHSVDGWVPTGRYALKGGVINGGSAPTNSNMITSATTSGKLTYAPFRWATGAGAYFMCTNTSGALSSGAIQLGAGSALRWGTAWLTVANFSQEAQFSTGYIKGLTGVNQLVLGGTTQVSTNAHVSFVNATGKIGVAVRDDGASFNNSININASAILDLTSTTRGFLPPRMTSAQMGAIANTEGLIVHNNDADRPHYNDGSSWKGFGDLYGLYSQTVVSATITGTTETSIVGSGVGGLSVPANGFTVGDSFHAKIGGLIGDTGNGDEITLYVYANAVLLASTGLISLDTTQAISAGGEGWEFELDFTVAAIGATGSICTNGNFAYTKTGDKKVQGYVFQDVQAIDTTIANSLDIRVKWNQTGQDIYSANFVLYRTYKA